MERENVKYFVISMEQIDPNIKQEVGRVENFQL